MSVDSDFIGYFEFNVHLVSPFMKTEVFIVSFYFNDPQQGFIVQGKKCPVLIILLSEPKCLNVSIFKELKK